MGYWLLKSEPDVWSLENQKKAGRKGSIWDGVRNYQAAKNLRKMKIKIWKFQKKLKTMVKIYLIMCSVSYKNIYK